MDNEDVASIRACVQSDRKNAIRKQTEIRERLMLSALPDHPQAHLDDPSYNYWAGQVAMADNVLSYIDAGERDL